jgi:tetratricopeptide (TPR) repeat protein
MQMGVCQRVVCLGERLIYAQSFRGRPFGAGQGLFDTLKEQSSLTEAMRQPMQGIAEAQRAQALDPVSLSAGCNTAHILYHAHLYDLAIEQALKVLDMDRNLARAHEELGRAYEQKGKYGQAILALREAVTNSGRSAGYLGSLAYAYVLSGSRKEAMKLLEELRKTAKKRYVSAYAFAIVCVGLGDKDGAFAWLRKACEEHSGALPFLKVNPRLVTLHSDVRFHELLGRVGLRS